MTKIAIIGSQGSGRTTLASKFGKKGNVTDVTMYDFARSGIILTATDATGYPKSIKPLVTALNLADIALLCIPPEGPDAYTGECMVALDTLGYRHGIVVLSKSDTTYPYALDSLRDTIKKITAGTVLENWEYVYVSTTTFDGIEDMKGMIATISERVDSELAELNDFSPRVVIDHVFNVTGIGCVVLGMVTEGTIRAKDKMVVQPAGKQVEIRSIQMHDVNVTSAPAGARVGLALKSIQSKDVDRGYVISEDGDGVVATDFTLNCTISRFTQRIMVGDMLHLFSGLQATPVRVEGIAVAGTDGMGGTDEVVWTDSDHAEPGSECVLKLSGSKRLAYTRSDRFVLANLDCEKQRFVGYGFSESIPLTPQPNN
ncbi:MAG: EF-Tu/IF-2/RF-3 family GTPase [Euryarchaeota archaeon]|nr:EF-Tu/IF-2/RF-3 family GTPase [Euryarchaeota archaeon]